MSIPKKIFDMGRSFLWDKETGRLTLPASEKDKDPWVSVDIVDKIEDRHDSSADALIYSIVMGKDPVIVDGSGGGMTTFSSTKPEPHDPLTVEKLKAAIEKLALHTDKASKTGKELQRLYEMAWDSVSAEQLGKELEGKSDVSKDEPETVSDEKGSW